MLTEIGPDGGALRTQDRNGVLFDLGGRDLRELPLFERKARLKKLAPI
jgi:hypothetical protein